MAVRVSTVPALCGERALRIGVGVVPSPLSSIVSRAESTRRVVAPRGLDLGNGEVRTKGEKGSMMNPEKRARYHRVLHPSLWVIDLTSPPLRKGVDADVPPLSSERSVGSFPEGPSPPSHCEPTPPCRGRWPAPAVGVPGGPEA